MPFSKLTGHAIVGGFGHLGSRVATQLRARGCEVAASASPAFTAAATTECDRLVALVGRDKLAELRGM